MTDTIYGWSQVAADNGTIDNDIDFAEFQTPSSVNDSARQLMARVAALISDTAPKRTSSGTGNNYIVSSDGAGSALVDGERVMFLPDKTNTGACTINVDGRGNKAWRPKTGVDFLPDNILTGVPVEAYYRQSTDEWLSPGTGYYVAAAASGVALQTITARLPQIGDMVVSFAPTPGPGRIRLTEATQAVLKSAYPELNSYLSGIGYPWGSTATHFNLPPAAGYFLRFAGTSSTVDTSGARTAGSTQSDQNKSHTHSVTATGSTDERGSHSHSASQPTGTQQVTTSGSGLYAHTDPDGPFTTEAAGGHTHDLVVAGTASATGSGGDEVRVKNVAFHCDVVASTALAASQVAAFGLPYLFDSGIASGDPGSGRIRFNNATLASVTQLFVDNEDRLAVSMTGIWGSTTAGDIITISKVGAQANRMVLEIASPATAGSGFYTVPVTVRASAGTFSNGDSIAVEYATGGTSGTTVPDISGLSEDVSPDLANDFWITYDTSASTHKKVRLNKLSPATTRGDIVVRGPSVDQRLGIGTSGQVLTSNGTDPSWQTPTLPVIGSFPILARSAIARDDRAIVYDTSAAAFKSIYPIGLQSFDPTDPEFGASTASSDNAVAFTACYNAIVAAGGGIMDIPAGLFKASAFPTVSSYGVHIRGAGQFATYLQQTTTTGDLITVTGNYCGVSNLTITPELRKTSGFAIRVSAGQNNFVRDVSIPYDWNGIAITATSNIANMEISNTTIGPLLGDYDIVAYGTSLSAGIFGLSLRAVSANNPWPGTIGTAGTRKTWTVSTAYSLNDVVVTNGRIYQCTTAGTSSGAGTGPNGLPAGTDPPTAFSGTITDGTAVWKLVCKVGLTGLSVDNYANSIRSLGDVAFLNGYYGMVVVDTAATGSSFPRYFHMLNMEIDHPYSHGVFLARGACFLMDLSWICYSLTGCGVLIDSTWTGETSLAGSRICANWSNGVQLAAGPKWTILSNSYLAKNAQIGSGLGYGFLALANATDFNVENCQAGDGTDPILTNNQAYGIAVTAGTSDRYHITGNLVNGNVTGGVFDGGSGANKTVSANH